MSSECPPLESLKVTLLSTDETISKRTHAAFYLRSFWKREAVDILSQALLNKDDSSLLRHEFAYILGQIGDPAAVPLLISILQDESDDILVRHESAEALGAIGDSSSLSALQKYAIYDAPEIAETCQIAIDLINWRQTGQVKPSSVFQSVDPAPAIDGAMTVDALQAVLMDTKLTLFERYRAMFKLRDMNCNESAVALLEGLKDSSALFRHEIAYVLGQMERSVTIDGLAKVLMNDTEHRMVRHEAAEALGAIGGSKVEEILSAYRSDSEIVVKESCEVALDNIEYWNNFSSVETQDN